MTSDVILITDHKIFVRCKNVYNHYLTTVVHTQCKNVCEWNIVHIYIFIISKYVYTNILILLMLFSFNIRYNKCMLYNIFDEFKWNINIMRI